MPDQSLAFWLNWYWEPSIVLGLIGLTVAYWLATGRYRSRFPGSEPLSSSQVAAFLSGIFILALALLSPLDQLSDEYLFTAHMVQHLLLTLVGPPLLLIGLPGWLFEPLRRWPPLLSAARLLTNPYVAFFSFNLVFAVWHLPAWYDAALADERIHIMEHLSFIATAVLTWMPILSNTPLLPRVSPPVAILYLFLQSVLPTVLGAIIVFAPDPLYPFYTTVPRVWGVSVMDDQVYAGLIMWTGGALIWLLALTIVFFKWFNREGPVEGQGLV